ncbi:MAG: zinc ribbon domain-containing protein [Desulfatiglans sp.]|nr:zinc ribbon domain-containing protein [Thermodesulfobacteriota bacterium]MEE4353435.1 zinc ribbon domain-containing protein [Desulfatiglans sp.]
MPIYEYKCSNCSEEFEILLFRSDEKVNCPACNGDNVKRLMSSAAFKSGDSFTPSSGSSACGSCSSGNCSTCH